MKEDQKEHGPIVEVINLKTNDVVKFHMLWTSTISDVWERAYAELDEIRGTADEFQGQDGTNLMQYLNLTLTQLRDQHICENRKFAIRGQTGGA